MKPTGISFEGTKSECRVASVHASDGAAIREATDMMIDSSCGVVAVRVREHLTPDDIAAMTDGVQRVKMQKEPGVSMDNRLKTLGVTQGSVWIPERYLPLARAWEQDTAFQQVAGETSGYVRKTIALLSEAFGMPAEQATQKGAPMLPAVIRWIDRANPHKDIVGGSSRNTGLWGVEQCRNDVAWNVHLLMPEAGGELVLYEKSATSCKQAIQLPTYAQHAVRPEAGDLIFFRSAVPHAVLQAEPAGSRMTLSGIMATHPTEEKLLYWA